MSRSCPSELEDFTPPPLLELATPLLDLVLDGSAFNPPLLAVVLLLEAVLLFSTFNDAIDPLLVLVALTALVSLVAALIVLVSLVGR